jgi:hypothetical protein
MLIFLTLFVPCFLLDTHPFYFFSGSLFMKNYTTCILQHSFYQHFLKQLGAIQKKALEVL